MPLKGKTTIKLNLRLPHLFRISDILIDMIRSSLPEGLAEGSVHDVVGGCWESMDVLWAQKPDPDLKSLMNGMDAFYQV